jgi:hypothetical protein
MFHLSVIYIYVTYYPNTLWNKSGIQVRHSKDGSSLFHAEAGGFNWEDSRAGNDLGTGCWGYDHSYVDANLLCGTSAGCHLDAYLWFICIVFSHGLV